MRVTIDAGGRKVEIECTDTNVTPDQIGDKALAVWKETEGAKLPSEGPAYGFQADRRGQYRSTWAFGENEQMPVRAEEC